MSQYWLVVYGSTVRATLPQKAASQKEAEILCFGVGHPSMVSQPLGAGKRAASAAYQKALKNVVSTLEVT